MRPDALTYSPSPAIDHGIRRGAGMLVLFFLVLIPFTQAQQTSLLTQYMFHQMTFNPAYAGAGGGICANGVLREQWMGFKDDDGNKVAPETFFVTIDAPIRKIHGALGGSVMQDKWGFFKNIGVKLGYAFRTDLGPGEFSAGLQANLMSYKIDFSKFDEEHIIDPGDPVFTDKGEKSDLTIDADLGFYYEVQDQYYIGLSATQLFQSKAKNIYYQQRRTYYLTGGYNWMIPNHPLFELKPSALVMFDGGSFQFDVAALLSYNKKFYGGLEYRYQDAVAVLVGAIIKNFRVGVSYDISTSSLTKYNSGSIEVSLGYCFKLELEKARKRYKNTRFL